MLYSRLNLNNDTFDFELPVNYTSESTLNCQSIMQFTAGNETHSFDFQEPETISAMDLAMDGMLNDDSGMTEIVRDFEISKIFVNDTLEFEEFDDQGNQNRKFIGLEAAKISNSRDPAIHQLITSEVLQPFENNKLPTSLNNSQDHSYENSHNDESVNDESNILNEKRYDLGYDSDDEPIRYSRKKPKLNIFKDDEGEEENSSEESIQQNRSGSHDSENAIDDGIKKKNKMHGTKNLKKGVAKSRKRVNKPVQRNETEVISKRKKVAVSKEKNTTLVKLNEKPSEKQAINKRNTPRRQTFAHEKMKISSDSQRKTAKLIDALYMPPKIHKVTCKFRCKSASKSDEIQSCIPSDGIKKKQDISG